ncbi:MAG: hypothetical protein F6J86_20000 [Symploca sp. SIO1B1]|nr:hypothetical protein [Symploca sp. SIO1B1]
MTQLKMSFRDKGDKGDKGDKEDRDTPEKIYIYSLLITHYSLLITHYSLLITHYSLLRIAPFKVCHGTTIT